MGLKSKALPIITTKLTRLLRIIFASNQFIANVAIKPLMRGVIEPLVRDVIEPLVRDVIEPPMRDVIEPLMRDSMRDS